MSLWAACGGKPDDSALPGRPITVSVKVWKIQGVPDTTASVFIPGNDRKPQSVDAQGVFSIPNVTPPYDLIVRMTSRRGDAYAQVYKGLTRKDPEVFSLESFSFETQQNTLTGKVTGQQPTSETSEVHVWQAQPGTGEAEYARLGGFRKADASGSFSMPTTWKANSTEAGSLFAMQYTLEKEHPKRYLAYGRRDGVSFQSSPPAMDLALSPVTSSSLSVDLTGAAGDERMGVGVRMETSDSFLIGLDYLNFTEMTSKKVSFAVPDISGATFRLNGQIGNMSWVRAGLKGGDSFTLGVPPAPLKPILPADSAKDVAANYTFACSQYPNALYMHYIQCGSYFAVIYLTTPQFTLPDLSAQGITLKSGDSCKWTAGAVSSNQSVDDMVDPSSLNQLKRAYTDTVFSTAFESSFYIAK